MPSSTRTIDKKKALIIALFLVTTLFVLTITRRGHFYGADIYRSGSGWGYDIARGKQVYIHQPFMPAMEGEVPFSSRKAARKTARLVIRKLKDHKLPSVTIEEIRDIIKN